MERQDDQADKTITLPIKSLWVVLELAVAVAGGAVAGANAPAILGDTSDHRVAALEAQVAVMKARCDSNSRFVEKLESRIEWLERKLYGHTASDQK